MNIPYNSDQNRGDLAKLEGATRLLAEVRDAHDAFRLMNAASAAEHYRRKMDMGAEAVSFAHAIKISAQSKLGGYLAAGPKAPGGMPYQSTGTTRGPVETAGPGPGADEAETDPASVLTLAEMGISKRLSAESQSLHRLESAAPEQFAAVLDGSKSLREVQRSDKRASVSEAAKLPTDKYRVIYADPPWRYGDQLTENYGSVKFHYPSLTIAELCLLPIVDIAADNAVLFLWVTSPMLEECFPVIKAWGFTYRTSIVWNKLAHNMGHYVSVRHEFLLICVRGSCLPDINKLLPSVVDVKRSKTHSQKPEEFRAMINALYPHGKRIELFARNEAEGWDLWGNHTAEKTQCSPVQEMNQ